MQTTKSSLVIKPEFASVADRSMEIMEEGEKLLSPVMDDTSSICRIILGSWGGEAVSLGTDGELVPDIILSCPPSNQTLNISKSMPYNGGAKRRA